MIRNQHSLKIWEKLKLFCFVFVCASAISLFSPNNLHAATDNGGWFGGNKNAQTQIFASLAGFEPYMSVMYRVLQQDGNIVSGTGSIDENGNLKLSLPTDAEILSYEFSIDGQDQTLNFKLIHENNRISVVGNGADDLSQIQIDVSGYKIDTKSDWAGLFEETGISIPENFSDDNVVKLAFFSTNPAQNIPNLQSNSSTIEVQFAPGGGGPDSDGVNDFIAVVCAMEPVASFCNAQNLAEQTQGIFENLIHPMQLMAEQISMVQMNAVMAIGRFADAKEQMEVQREFQTLKTESLKDYHPSDQMCRVGSMMKSVVTTQQKAEHEKMALNKIFTDQYSNKRNVGTKSGEISDSDARMKQYREVYCDPMDHGGTLFLACEHDQDELIRNSTMRALPPGGIGAPEQFRVNKDIDYIRTVEFPLTLDIDSIDPEVSPDEEDVAALGKNLFWSEVFETLDDAQMKADRDTYVNARGLMALNNLAHNSYTHIVSSKASAPDPPEGEVPGWAHMKTLMREFGLEDDHIAALLGVNPSYHAQMDILTKKLYQNPDFYTNLYDKPTNVDRIDASMEAIRLMQLRDFYEASLRKEMVLSGMLHEAMLPRLRRIQGIAGNLE